MEGNRAQPPLKSRSENSVPGLKVSALNQKIELLRGSDELGLLSQLEAPGSLDELLELAGTDDFADLIDDPSGLLDTSSP